MLQMRECFTSLTYLLLLTIQINAFRSGGFTRTYIRSRNHPILKSTVDNLQVSDEEREDFRAKLLHACDTQTTNYLNSSNVNFIVDVEAESSIVDMVDVLSNMSHPSSKEMYMGNLINQIQKPRHMYHRVKDFFMSITKWFTTVFSRFFPPPKKKKYTSDTPIPSSFFGIHNSETSKSDSNNNACLLDGLWSLRFTTDPHCRWLASTDPENAAMQSVNSTEGQLVYKVEWNEKHRTKKSFSKGFITNTQVTNVSQYRMYFKTSHCKLFHSISFLPSLPIIPPLFPLLRFFLPFRARASKQTGKFGVWGFSGSGTEYLDLLYLDDDLQITKNNLGKIFVASRLYQCWDPLKPQGWTYVSVI